VRAARVDSQPMLDAAIDRARSAAADWQIQGPEQRRAILHRIGDALQTMRGDLLEVMAAETGKTLQEGDPEVSEAIDFAHYYAEQIAELETIEGARFEPASLTV